MAAGASDNGEPGARLHYDLRYYAANILDPDGIIIIGNGFAISQMNGILLVKIHETEYVLTRLRVRSFYQFGEWAERNCCWRSAGEGDDPFAWHEYFHAFAGTKVSLNSSHYNRHHVGI
jgi:hypothetical protein